MLSIHARHDQRAIIGVLPGLILAELIGTELPSQLDLILNCAVLLEIPVEQVPALQFPAGSHRFSLFLCMPDPDIAALLSMSLVHVHTAIVL